MGTIEVKYRDTEHQATILSKVGVGIGEDLTVYRVKTVKLLFKKG